MNFILLSILVPIVTGSLLWLIPGKLKKVKGTITLGISLLLFYYTFQIFKLPNAKMVYTSFGNTVISGFLTFNVDHLSKLIVLFIGFFGSMISMYSIKFVENSDKFKGYYTKFLFTLSASLGAVLSDNLITLTLFWGFLGLTLYRFLRGSDKKTTAAAKKSFILIGASDSILILGIGFLWLKTGTLLMSGMSLTLSGTAAVIGFLSLLIASLTKAGAFPVHTWLPDYAEAAPSPISALLPASLDKLLGIYFLARICMNIFILNNWAKMLLLIIGAVTIISAVMMALIQHNYKKLLGYHAVSQVGYMVTGIGLGTPLGIAGGLFHMLNNTLYKSGLFLTSGAVYKQTKENNLENLGGLALSMPFTFFSALIFALSISGVPPFNGFISKWVIYQGIIELGKSGGTLVSNLWFVWLGAAVLGSALTLASFIKLIGGIYLGKKNNLLKNIKEVSIFMWLPSMIITVLCVGFGIWGTSYVLPKLIAPITGKIRYIGFWSSQTGGILIIAGIVLGIALYYLGTIKNIKRKKVFIGGEPVSNEINYSTVEFYKTISGFNIIKQLYHGAKKKYFDIYDIGKNFILYLNGILKKAHTGILPLYILWAFIGLIIILLILV